MKGRRWAWILVALALVPAWLIRDRPPARIPAESAPAVIAVTASPDSLDPARGRDIAARLIDDNVFETLFRLTPGGRLIPALAASGSVSGRRVVIRIRPQRLANGRIVTAGMVGRALARTLWPEIGSPVALRLLGDVVGAARVASGKTRWIQGVTAPLPDRLVIRLKRPDPAFLDVLANPALAIVPVADMRAGGPYWTATDLVGSGAYVLTSAVPGAQWSLRRVRGPGPAVATVERYPDWRTAVLGFANGDVAAVPVPWPDIGKVPIALRSDLRVLAAPGRLQLVVAQSPSNPWTQPGRLARVLPGGGLDTVVQKAFAGTVGVRSPRKTRGSRRPGSVGGAASPPLRLAFDVDQPMAVQFAATWAHLAKGRLVTVPLTGSALTAAVEQGRVDAAVFVDAPDAPPIWPAAVRATRRTLAPAAWAWLVRAGASTLTVFGDGSLDLSTWR